MSFFSCISVHAQRKSKSKKQNNIYPTNHPYTGKVQDVFGFKLGTHIKDWKSWGFVFRDDDSDTYEALSGNIKVPDILNPFTKATAYVDRRNGSVYEITFDLGGYNGSRYFNIYSALNKKDGYTLKSESDQPIRGTLEYRKAFFEDKDRDIQVKLFAEKSIGSGGDTTISYCLKSVADEIFMMRTKREEKSLKDASKDL